MADRARTHRAGFEAGADQPLLGVMVDKDGCEVVRYFTDEEDAEAGDRQEDLERALKALGAWADLNWEEAEAELDRIRHESRPTPPLDL